MNKIINGKRYDTETSKLIGTAYSRYPKNDFSYWEETLYRKRTGEYFLHGWGNANSRYSESMGDNTWSGSEKIIPLTYDTAKAWVEKHLEAEVYEQYFELAPEDYVIQSVTMPEYINEAVRQMAAEQGMTISAVVTEALVKLFG